MDNLWAPWRMEFIENLRDSTGGCIFCELAQAGDDREKLVLCRLNLTYVVMNRYPYNNGHLLLVPFRHQARLVDLTAEEQAELMRLNADSVELLSQTLDCDGVNCGINIGKAAGAGVTDHVHIHVVPRWNGDTNFMPIISDTRSMPEYLENTYDRMVKSFKQLER